MASGTLLYAFRMTTVTTLVVARCPTLTPGRAWLTSTFLVEKDVLVPRIARIAAGTQVAATSLVVHRTNVRTGPSIANKRCPSVTEVLLLTSPVVVLTQPLLFCLLSRCLSLLPSGVSTQSGTLSRVLRAAGRETSTRSGDTLSRNRPIAGLQVVRAAWQTATARLTATPVGRVTYR